MKPGPWPSLLDYQSHDQRQNRGSLSESLGGADTSECFCSEGGLSKIGGTNSRQPHLPDDPLDWVSVTSWLNACQGVGWPELEDLLACCGHCLLDPHHSDGEYIDSRYYSEVQREIWRARVQCGGERCGWTASHKSQVGGVWSWRACHSPSWPVEPALHVWLWKNKSSSQNLPSIHSVPIPN